MVRSLGGGLRRRISFLGGDRLPKVYEKKIKKSAEDAAKNSHQSEIVFSTLSSQINAISAQLAELRVENQRLDLQIKNLKQANKKLNDTVRILKSDTNKRFKERRAAQKKSLQRVEAKIEKIADILNLFWGQLRSNTATKDLTVQERMWRTQYGVHYILRNAYKNPLETKLPLFLEIQKELRQCSDIFEIGTNLAGNLTAISEIVPSAKLSGLEINDLCVSHVSASTNFDVACGSIIDFEPLTSYDFVFTRGVLIHINPDHLDNVLMKMAKMSRRYVFIAEHYSEQILVDQNYPPSGVNVDKDHQYLWRRDFYSIFERLNPEFSRSHSFEWPPNSTKGERSNFHCVLYERTRGTVDANMVKI